MKVSALAFFTIFCLLGGCARSPMVKVSGPEWVLRGISGLKKTDRKVFYAVGRAGPEIKVKTFRIEVADNRARAEMQKVFDTYSATLMKDYANEDNAAVERAIKLFSVGHLSGVQVVDRYFEPDGTVHSLVELDLATFQEAMELASELSKSAREYIRKRAEKLFEELEKEEEKHKSKF